MLGSEFIATYAQRGAAVWERAALALAQAQDGLVPWPWVDLTLTDGPDTATLKIQADVLAVGTFEDHVRLPMTPTMAQAVANVTGALLPTPWIAYQVWRNAIAKLEPHPMVPNQGANLAQYAAHSSVIDAQLSQAGFQPDAPIEGFVCGTKKAVVVSNLYQPGKVLIFGWYRPPPAPDVFDDGSKMESMTRQPIQPRSNVHGDFYVDYSHGIRLVHPQCMVNGQMMRTEDLYQHLTLARLVSNEQSDGRIVPPGAPGQPVRKPRYPAPVKPLAGSGGGAVALYQDQDDVRVPTEPSTTNQGLAFLAGGGLRSA